MPIDSGNPGREIEDDVSDVISTRPTSALSAVDHHHGRKAGRRSDELGCCRSSPRRAFRAR